MLNIIKSDLYRILHGKTIYIIIIIAIIMNFVSAISMSAGHIGLAFSNQSPIDITDAEFLEELSHANSLGQVRSLMKKVGNFALDLDVIGQNVNLYYFFIAIVVIIICTDFSNKSIKNTLTSAISKKKYYISKTILIFGLCTILILFNNYFFYLINIIINGTNFSSNIIDFTKYTMIQFIPIYGIISLLICLAFLFKRTSSFNTISIPFIMAFQLLIMGFTSILHIKADWFYQYEIQFMLANLVNSPAINYVVKCTILGIIYILVFNIVGYYAFKNAEIK